MCGQASDRKVLNNFSADTLAYLLHQTLNLKVFPGHIDYALHQNPKLQV